MSMTSIVPRRVVIGAASHAELSAALVAARPSLEVRGNKHTELTPADLEWGDTYVGFRRPPLATMGNIRWVHCTGAGVDSWLYPTELARDVLLTRTAESFGPMIAEWALARALAFSQQLSRLAEDQRERVWSSREVSLIRGTTAAVVGTGDVGSHAAKLFTALGCRVIGVSRSGRGDRSIFAELHQANALRDVVERVDWLILALPHTSETRRLVSRELLSLCRDVVLINAGRGVVVDESAIPEALDRGWLRGAALDVFEVEPLPATSPLWNDPRVMISPHISGPTTIAGAIGGFLECLAEVERGVAPARTVDRERGY
jgi:phosphoglycerate dehydrogenase-like enzyme